MGIFTNPSVSGVLAAQGQVPQILAQSAIPVGIAQSGTVATNGTITFTNALPAAYAGIWLYFPATAMADGLAGFRWCTSVAASTTNFQVTTAYLAAMSIPAIPTGYSNGVGSNSAYTGSTAEITLSNVTVPGGMMGPNGRLRIRRKGTANNTAGAKISGTRFGGTQFFSAGMANYLSYTHDVEIFNAGVTNVQVGSPTNVGVDWNVSTQPYSRSAIDTSIAQTIALNYQLATATDYAISEAFSIEVLPG
jgi:hypothetical protein